MSALGISGHWVRSMSALPPKADIERYERDVRFVPKADICSAAKKARVEFCVTPFTVRPGTSAPLGHAFESVNAAILKADSRLRHQILDRARNQDFTGTRFRGNARADVKRETDQTLDGAASTSEI
jgi:hypothetical protein